MLQPHPAILRKLVEEYEQYAQDEEHDKLVLQEGPQVVTRPGQRAQDLAYTLCVTTGTRDVRAALEAARRQLAVAYAPLTGDPVTRDPVPEAPGSRAGTGLGEPAAGGAPVGA